MSPSIELSNLISKLIELHYNFEVSKVFSNHIRIQKRNPYRVETTINIDYYPGSNRFEINGVPKYSIDKVLNYLANKFDN